ncbi:MAG TPA: sigma-70 family RNA polymerase sigma factor [Chloroflexota bacterium]|nr:sigma-70 family RNA polymerase sigma factor [Chloroflexota bacterium]
MHEKQQYVDEAALVRAAQASSIAFAPLYERYYPVVLAFAARRTRDRMQAEDVAAQTFLQALQALHRYEHRGTPFVAWLLRIATHVAVDQAQPRRVTPLPLSALQTSDEGHTKELPSKSWLDGWERSTWLQGHLHTLPMDHRHVLWLRYGEGRSVSDVAARIGRSETATRVLLHRIIKTLRTRMEAESIP